MNLNISFVEQDKQPTPRRVNYWEEVVDERTVITHLQVSKMDDMRYEYLLLVHGIVELILLKLSGTAPKALPEPSTRMDENFEPNLLAETMTHLFALFLGVRWTDYQSALQSKV